MLIYLKMTLSDYSDYKFVLSVSNPSEDHLKCYSGLNLCLFSYHFHIVADKHLLKTDLIHFKEELVESASNMKRYISTVGSALF